MAPPDLNSIPSRSSRTPSTSNTNINFQSESPELSRRTSSAMASAMGPPPLPNTTSLPNSPRAPAISMVDTSAVATGPIRHPRPLTAAELHLELEKEQESIVNRLTRELSALRAQTASVASTASSTSDLFSSQNLSEYSSQYQPGTGASIIPTSARRQRSSSNLSTRSARSARDTIANTARDAATTSVSGVAAPRDSHQVSSRPSMEISRERPEISRQNSMTGYRSASATSPYMSSHPSYGHAHRISVGSATNSGQNLDARSPSFGSAAAAARYEEAAIQRQELESVKRENELLKQRIRELERTLAQGGSLGSAQLPITGTEPISIVAPVAAAAESVGGS